MFSQHHIASFADKIVTVRYLTVDKSNGAAKTEEERSTGKVKSVDRAGTIILSVRKPSAHLDGKTVPQDYRIERAALLMIRPGV